MKRRALQLCSLATEGTQEPAPTFRRPPAIPEQARLPAFPAIRVSYMIISSMLLSK